MAKSKPKWLVTAVVLLAIFGVLVIATLIPGLNSLMMKGLGALYGHLPFAELSVGLYNVIASKSASGLSETVKQYDILYQVIQALVSVFVVTVVEFFMKKKTRLFTRSVILFFVCLVANVIFSLLFGNDLRVLLMERKTEAILVIILIAVILAVTVILLNIKGKKSVIKSMVKSLLSVLMDVICVIPVALFVAMLYMAFSSSSPLFILFAAVCILLYVGLKYIDSRIMR